MPDPSESATTDKRLLLAAVATVVLASLLAWRVQTAGGSVDVMAIKIPTQNGQWVVADLFKPRAASKEKPAPLVVVVPGFQRSKEALANVSIELARRGIVAIAIDPYGQGGSSSSMSRRAATTEGYGMFAVVDYASRTGVLNYVDKSRIGATGHSAGGNAAIRGANYFGRRARRGKSRLHSVFVSGYVLTLRDNVLRDVRSNVGVSYAFYDEGAYRNALGHGDLRRAPEALRVVNSVRGGPEPPITEVEIGRYYGDAEARTLRVVYNERTLHPFQPYDREAMRNQILFFTRAFGLAPELGPNDQTWYWKELLGLIALVAAFVSIVPMARLLLRLDYFRLLVHTIPPPLPRPRGAGRIVFWSVITASMLIAAFTYIPMAELSQRVFVSATTRHQTWFFPQRMNNAVMLWAVLNGTVGFLLFFGVYRLFGRSRGVVRAMWGGETSLRELWRTVVLAGLVFGAFYALLFAVYAIFHVDYRFLFMGARVFSPVLWIILAMYAPFFFIFFLSNSLRVNGALRVAGDSELKSMFLAGLANSLGLLLIVAVQYATFFATGTVYWTDGWLYVNLLFGVVPMMFVLPWFNRIFFRMTGRIYLGPLVTCLIFVMILLSNTVCYIPL